jgi:hypothetical protein
LRRIVLLLALTVGIASQAMAATPITVAELEQLLAAAHGQSDGKVAKQLSDLELTERASSIRLARWEAEFPGRHCHEALTELADASAFLDLPAADLPATAPPDEDAQKAMLARTVEYVNKTVSRLPNFYATRRTEHFEDSPPRQTTGPSIGGRASALGGRGISAISSEQSSYVPMHSAGSSNVTVSYRDGYELRGSKKVDPSRMGQTPGLNTAGEFGPILSLVLDNAMRSQRTWGHWEQTASGVAAVFRYSVPRGQSSYFVTLQHNGTIQQVFPAYHGEIAIDPADGAILRVTVVADFAPPYNQEVSSIMVEYGSVSIGGAPYICPVKSVAFSKTAAFPGENGSPNQPPPLQTRFNDVAFIDYHIFRAEARILTGDSVSNEEPPARPK